MIYISELKKYVPPGTYFFWWFISENTKKYHQKISPKKYESNISVKIWPWNLGVVNWQVSAFPDLPLYSHNDNGRCSTIRWGCVGHWHALLSCSYERVSMAEHHVNWNAANILYEINSRAPVSMWLWCHYSYPSSNSLYLIIYVSPVRLCQLLH